MYSDLHPFTPNQQCGTNWNPLDLRNIRNDQMIDRSWMGPQCNCPSKLSFIWQMRYSPLARSKLIYFILTAKVTTKTWQISRNFHKTFVQLFKCSSLWHFQTPMDRLSCGLWRSSKPWGADNGISHTREPVSWQCLIGYLVQQHKFVPLVCLAWS